MKSSVKTSNHFHMLPKDLTNKTILEIGCWEGDVCVECVKRGAKVTGIDIETSDRLIANLENHNFEFLQLDMFSEKFLQLPTYDYVFCFGVLYHVENIISALTRIRTKAAQSVILENVFNNLDGPVMMYHTADTLKNNFSNWWTGTPECFEMMMTDIGYRDITINIGTKPRDYGVSEIAFHRGYIHASTNNNTAPTDKIYSRRKDRLGIYKGKR